MENEIKNAIIVFHYAEKIKSNLIIAAKLLEALENMKEDEVIGAEKILASYFNALIMEVNIAANASEENSFKDVSEKLDEVIKLVLQHNYAEAIRLVSETISIVTTNGNSSAEILREKNLI
ncbi:MAG: hypothetical protein ACP5IM_05645 [Candidatus Bathyarchaeia archaeon]|nr:MAG: hypothetical protein C0195_01370 [Candidatus Bathyarchaeota archaeon]